MREKARNIIGGIVQKKPQKGNHTYEHSKQGVGIGGRINGKTLPCIDVCVIDGPTIYDKSVYYVVTVIIIIVINYMDISLKIKKGDFETGTKNRHFRYAFTGTHN